MARWRYALLALVLFSGGVIAANRLAHLTVSGAAVPYWPLHIFHPRSPGIRDIAVAALTVALFLLAIVRLERTGYRSIAEVVTFGALLVLATNAVQGGDFAFVHPIAGGSIQYYHDAREHAEDPVDDHQRPGEAGEPGGPWRHRGRIAQPTLRTHGTLLI